MHQLVPDIKKPVFILSVEGLICELTPAEPSDWAAARKADETVRAARAVSLERPNALPQVSSGTLRYRAVLLHGHT